MDKLVEIINLELEMYRKDLLNKIDVYARIYTNNQPKYKATVITLEKLINRIFEEMKQTIEANLRIIDSIY